MELDQYLGIFIDESRENLQKLSESLLELETNPDNTELLNDIFRVAHTLKGMSKTMGFNAIGDLTHNMENVLDPLRSGKLKANSDVIDVLFKCLDKLEGLIGNVIEGTYDDKNSPIDDLVKNLQKILGAADEPEPMKEEVSIKPEFNEYEISVIDTAQGDGFKVYEIILTLSAECMLKGARAYMATKAIEPFGDLIKTCPVTDDLENGDFERKFNLYLVTKDKVEEINEAISKVSEIDEIKIEELNLKKYMEDPEEEEQADSEAAESSEDNSEKPKADDKTQKNAAEKANISKVAQQTIRVNADRMDVLMNLVGELVINKTRIVQLMSDKRFEDLNNAVEGMGSIITEVQEIVMALRMVSIEQVFNRFPRVVRDISKNQKKEVNFKVTGQNTEIDRIIVDEIGDPLIHLIRNSLDHGLESPEERASLGKPVKGTLELMACNEGDNVIIKVCDDGKGMDPQKIKASAIKKGMITAEAAKNMNDKELIDLIFAPGMSTAEVTTDISGRGVGMDVVKSRISHLGGNVSVYSVIGKGTTITISLPSTMSIVQALLIKVGHEVYAAPLNYISEVINIYPEQIRNVQNNDIIVLRGKTLPLVKLSKLLEVPGYMEDPDEPLTVVIVKSQGQSFGFVVSELVGQQEIVIKPINKKLCSEDYISGATTLGNGMVALILNVNELLKSKAK